MDHGPKSEMSSKTFRKSVGENVCDVRLAKESDMMPKKNDLEKKKRSLILHPNLNSTGRDLILAKEPVI